MSTFNTFQSNLYLHTLMEEVLLRELRDRYTIPLSLQFVALMKRDATAAAIMMQVRPIQLEVQPESVVAASRDILEDGQLDQGPV